MEYPHKWRAFIGICILSFGVFLDYTVVNIALPTIRQELHTTVARLQWVMSLFFLGLAIFSSIMGRVGDIHGRIKLFYIGVLIFLCSSIVAGASPGIGVLVLARFIQGVGSAIIIPMSMSILPSCVPDEDHAKFIGWLGSFGGLSLALGPLIGGYVVTYLGWRYIFYLNVPLVAIGFCFCYGVLQEGVLQAQSKLDWWGAFLIIPTIGGLVLSVMHSETYGWGNAVTLTYLGIAVAGGIILYLVEKGLDDPVIDFSSFGKLLFFSGAMVAFISGVLSAVALFFDPLYLQLVLNETVKTSGWVMTAIPVMVLVVSYFIGAISDKIGLITTGLIGFVAAMVAAVMHASFNASTSMVFIIFALMLFGVTWAMGNSVSIVSGQKAVESYRISVATGTIVTMFNVAGAVGIAIAVVIYHHFSMQALLRYMQIGREHLSHLQYLKLRELVSNPSHLASQQQHDLFDQLFMHGFSATMWYLFVVSSGIFAIIFLWKLISQREVV